MNESEARTSQNTVQERDVRSDPDKVPPAKSSKYPKFNDPALDPLRLYEVLQKEIHKETSYDLENDAKLRAVTQGTVNYEQFRQMVLGAHIRPLEKKDKIEGLQNGKKPYVVWNTTAKNIKVDPDKLNPPSHNDGVCFDVSHEG